MSDVKIDDGALDLMSQIVAANVDAAARTTDRLIRFAEEQRNDLAVTLRDVLVELSKIPRASRTLPVQDVIDAYWWRVEQAREFGWLGEERVQ